MIGLSIKEMDTLIEKRFHADLGRRVDKRVLDAATRTGEALARPRPLSDAEYESTGRDFCKCFRLTITRKPSP